MSPKHKQCDSLLRDHGGGLLLEREMLLIAFGGIPISYQLWGVLTVLAPAATVALYLKRFYLPFTILRDEPLFISVLLLLTQP